MKIIFKNLNIKLLLQTNLIAINNNYVLGSGQQVKSIKTDNLSVKFY